MKILITGGTGFIGRHLLVYWKNSSHSITVLARSFNASLAGNGIKRLQVDITVKEDIQAAIFLVQPDIIVHTAAMSKPNDCEIDKEQCFATNVAATGYITEACKRIQVKLIFLSTDFVFGNNGPYSEADNYEPVNYYGQSKMLAEQTIKEAGIAYAIVRTGLVIGSRLAGQPNTFLHWVKESLEAGKTIKLYTDQQRSPTFITDLCSGINAIIETDFTGIIHLSGNESFTPYSLAQQVALYCKCSQSLMIAVVYQQQPEPAMRPQNAVLKIDKAKAVLRYTVTPFSEVLKAVFPGSSGLF